MGKQTVFKKVMVTDRLPKERIYVPTINTLGGIDTLYHIGDGEFTNSHVDTDTFNYIESWLEEIELPSEEEVYSELTSEVNLSPRLQNSTKEIYKFAVTRTTSYILNKLK